MEILPPVDAEKTIERKDWLFRKYGVPKSMVKSFDKDMERLRKREGEDEWYEMAEKFETDYGKYLT